MAYLMQLSCVINRTACRSILAGASSLVDSTNTMLAEVCTSGQCDEKQFGKKFSSGA